MPPDLTRGRRDVFLGFKPDLTVHPGLWLARFLGLQTWHHDRQPPTYVKEDAQRARDELLSQIEGRPLPQGYARAFDRWCSAFDPERSVVDRARARGRVIVGLGGKGVSEVGITLHHTWGVPVLPGSSLKGIAALGARRFLEGWEGRPHPDAVRAEGPTPYDALFGDVEEQGAVVFHDAWMVPTPDDKNPIHRDVMTVHHPDYYQDGEEPADTESPIPVPFVSASGSWLVALELAPGLDPEAHGAWLEAAWTALRLGLDRHGIGSKTNAGYGRFDLRVWGETGAGRAQTERERRAAELREEARRVFEMEQTRARRLSLVTPMDRVMDVLRSEGEGAALLRRWIATGGAAEVAGLPTDQDHVVATVRALFDAHRAEGLKAAAPEGWRTWVAEGLTTPAIVAPRRALREGELDVLVKRHTRRGKIEYHKMVTSLHRARLDVAGLQIAIERLRQLGASSGHLRSLVVDLESAATEE